MIKSVFSNLTWRGAIWRIALLLVCAWVCWLRIPQHGSQQNTRYFSDLVLQGHWGMPDKVGECFEHQGKYFPAYQPLVSLTPPALF